MDSTALTILGLSAGSGVGAAKFLLDKLLGPTLNVVGQGIVPAGLLAWKGQRTKRAEQIIERAGQLIVAAGSEPREVPGRILLPLLDKGSMEEESDIRDKWAALLANTSIYPETVLPAFVSILSELSPVEARMLDAIGRERPRSYQPSSAELYLRHIQGQLTVDQLRIGITNLVRLNIATSDLSVGGLDPLSDQEFLGRRIMLTRFGRAFVDACTPPASS